MHPPAAPETSSDEGRAHFRKVHRTYQSAMDGDAFVAVHDRIRREIEPRLGRRVLDVGSGGVPDFLSTPARTVVSMDYELESLLHGTRAAVLGVAGDILRIPLRAASVDSVIAQQVFHYLTDPPFSSSGAATGRALAEARRVLTPGGTLFIVDSAVPGLLLLAQRAVYGLSYPLLRALKRPTVFIPTVRRLRRQLAAAGFGSSRVKIIDWGDAAGASATLFPRLRFPLRRLPVRCVVISARKGSDA